MLPHCTGPSFRFVFLAAGGRESSALYKSIAYPGFSSEFPKEGREQGQPPRTTEAESMKVNEAPGVSPHIFHTLDVVAYEHWMTGGGVE